MGLLWLPGRMPGLNDIIDQSAGASKGWSAYNATKKKWSGNIKLVANAKGLGHIKPSAFTYLVCEPNRRRDPSNMVSGAVKLIEDALQEAGLLDNDGWNDVLDFRAHWIVKAERVGVLVHWARECQSKETMLALLEEELVGHGNQGFDKNGLGSGNSRDAGPRAHAAKAAGGDAPARGELGGGAAVAGRGGASASGRPEPAAAAGRGGSNG